MDCELTMVLKGEVDEDYAESAQNVCQCFSKAVKDCSTGEDFRLLGLSIGFAGYAMADDNVGPWTRTICAAAKKAGVSAVQDLDVDSMTFIDDGNPTRKDKSVFNDFSGTSEEFLDKFENDQDFSEKVKSTAIKSLAEHIRDTLMNALAIKHGSAGGAHSFDEIKKECLEESEKLFGHLEGKAINRVGLRNLIVKAWRRAADIADAVEMS